MNWLKGSFDVGGRIYISRKIRMLAGVGGEVEYTIDADEGAIKIRKSNIGAE